MRFQLRSLILSALISVCPSITWGDSLYIQTKDWAELDQMNGHVRLHAPANVNGPDTDMITFFSVDGPPENMSIYSKTLYCSNGIFQAFTGSYQEYPIIDNDDSQRISMFMATGAAAKNLMMSTFSRGNYPWWVTIIDSLRNKIVKKGDLESQDYNELCTPQAIQKLRAYSVHRMNNTVQDGTYRICVNSRNGIVDVYWDKKYFERLIDQKILRLAAAFGEEFVQELMAAGVQGPPALQTVPGCEQRQSQNNNSNGSSSSDSNKKSGGIINFKQEK